MPILLLSISRKIFERSVCKKIFSFSAKNNNTFKCQFAYKSLYSINHTIVIVVESIEKYVDDCKYVYIEFIENFIP